jgi:hypothetical protein
MASVLLPSVHRAGLFGLGLGLTVLGASVAAGCYFGHHVRTAFEGPTKVKLEDIARLEDTQQLPSTWVDVKFDKSVKSSLVIEKRPTNGGISHVSEEFLIFQAGDRWMIAAVPRGFKGKEVSGQIWHRTDNALLDIVAGITKELEATHKGKLFPFEFDASDDYGDKWKTVGGIIIFFVAAGILFTWLGVDRIRKSYRPPKPADYGLDPADYTDLVVETPADAEAAVARFIRDAGLTPDPEWQRNA